MSFVVGSIIIGGAIAGGGVATGLIGRAAKKEEVASAEADRKRLKNEYSQMDNSNLYAGFQNSMQNLSVNTQQAQFQQQQQRQSQANILSALRGSAGSSGIAGLAQALQGQSNLAAQQSSASIGMQEQRNQMASAQGEMQAQQIRMGGAAQARSLKQQQLATQYGIAMQREGSANEVLAQNDAQMMDTVMEGVGMAAGGVAQGYNDGTFGGGGKKVKKTGGGKVAFENSTGQRSDRRLKKNIKLIGESFNNVNIYTFEYKNKLHGEGVFQGVMSDDIPIEFVIKGEDGFDLVDYSGLDVEFKNI